MSETFDPDRFIQAQDPLIAQVEAELRHGRKRTHWMWFVFPQLGGLGHSAMAQRFSIGSLDAAQAYLRHPVLGPRLVQHSALVTQVEGRSIHEIFGSPDDLKFHSSMTLFSLVPDADPVFDAALAKYFDAVRDERTCHRLAAA